jgi:hypothetical protein
MDQPTNPTNPESNRAKISGPIQTRKPNPTNMEINIFKTPQKYKS